MMDGQKTMFGMVFTAFLFGLFWHIHNLFAGEIPAISELVMQVNRDGELKLVWTLPFSISRSWDMLVAPFFVLAFSWLMSKTKEERRGLILELSMVVLFVVGLITGLIGTLTLLIVGVVMGVIIGAGHGLFYGLFHGLIVIAVYGLCFGFAYGTFWSMPLGIIFGSAVALSSMILLGFGLGLKRVCQSFSQPEPELEVNT